MSLQYSVCLILSSHTHWSLMCTQSSTFLHIFTHLHDFIHSRWWLDLVGGTQEWQRSWEQLTPKILWNMVKLQGSPVWHCSLSWHWSRWTWRSALWLSALLPQSWFACKGKIRPNFSISTANLFSIKMLKLSRNKYLPLKNRRLRAKYDVLTSSLPDLFCCRLAWWWHHFLSLSWHHQSICRSAGMS